MPKLSLLAFRAFGNLFMDQDAIVVLKDNTKAVFVILIVITKRSIPYCFQSCFLGG